MFYDTIIDERAKKSHLTRKTIEIAKGYFDYINDNRYIGSMDSFLDYLDLTKPRYSDAIRARSLVAGIMVRDFYADKKEWYIGDTYNQILDVCDLEKESEQFITHDEWLQYEEKMHEMFVEQKLYFSSMAYYYAVYEFAWNGVERSDLQKMDVDTDIEIKDDNTIVAHLSDEEAIEFKSETLAWVLKNGIVKNKFDYFVRGYGKVRKQFLEYIDRGLEDKKPYCMTLYAVYVSGVMYRVSCGLECLNIEQEAMVEYYNRMIDILYKK